MYSMKRNDINNLTHSRFLKIEELPHYLDFSLQMFFYSFVLIQKKQKIKAVNCLTAGFSSTRHHLNGP